MLEAYTRGHDQYHQVRKHTYGSRDLLAKAVSLYQITNAAANAGLISWTWLVFWNSLTIRSSIGNGTPT